MKKFTIGNSEVFRRKKINFYGLFIGKHFNVNDFKKIIIKFMDSD